MGLGHDVPSLGKAGPLRLRGPTSQNGPEADIGRLGSNAAILEVFLIVLEFVFLVDLVVLLVPMPHRFAAPRRKRTFQNP